jgi:hypothetical protein
LCLVDLMSIFFENCWPANLQFHRHFTGSFFLRKFCAQLSRSYNLGLHFFGARISAQKLLEKCWWNWHLNLSNRIVRGHSNNTWHSWGTVSQNLWHKGEGGGLRKCHVTFFQKKLSPILHFGLFSMILGHYF